MPHHHSEACCVFVAQPVQHAAPKIEQPFPAPCHKIKKASPVSPNEPCAQNLLPAFEHGRAHHGCRGERDDHGDEHCHRKDNGKFPEDAAKDAWHEQDGDKDCHKGEGHGDNGKAHLARAVQGRAQGRFPLFQPAHYVFQNNNGVVHHKARGNGEGHEGEVVQGVAKDVHDSKGSYEGDRCSYCRYGRCPVVAQKEEDHQDHQNHGEHKAQLHLCQRGADGDGSVHGYVHGHGLCHPLAHARHHGLYAIHCLYDVGALGLEDHEQDCGLVVEDGHGAHILRPTLYGCHILQAHHTPVGGFQDELPVVLGIVQLIVDANKPVVVAVFNQAPGHEDV